MADDSENAAVREELRRVTTSEAFRGSDRLRRFLEYVVLETIEGRGATLKEYSIGLSVFEKPESFDPKVDSTVRSEGSKLRTKLRLYYETEGRENPIVIAIPKGGYAASWQERISVPPPVPAARPGRRVPILLVLAGFAGAVALTGWWSVRTTPSSQADPNDGMRRLTNDSLSSYPFISKGGSLLVCSSDRAGRGDLDLWLQPVSSKDAIRLTDDPADDYDAAISPDESMIAFRSDREGGGIYVMPALGGKPRLLAAGGSRPRFSPDGQWIAYSVSNPRYFLHVSGSGTAYMIHVRSGTRQAIAPGFASSHFPIFSPDGELILFTGKKEEKDHAGALDWWKVPTGGGEPVRTGIRKILDGQRLTGPDFLHPVLPDAWLGNHVIFGARWGDERNLWRLRLSDGLPAGKPERITRGASTGMQPSVSHSGALVFSSAVPNSHIVSLPLEAETGISKGPALPLAPGPDADHWPSVTRDGKKVVFFSSMRMRSSGALYLYDVETSQVSTLIDRPGLRPWSEISRNGDSIVYHAQSDTGYDAWEQPVSGGAPAVLCQSCLFMGWTSDRRTLLYTTIHDPLQILRRNIDSGAVSNYIRSEKGVSQPALSPDEHWMTFYERLTPDRTRIYLAPWTAQSSAPRTEWVPVTDGTSHDTSPIWSPQGRVLYFGSNRDGFTCIYGQRVKPGLNKLDGPPFPVRHLHAAAERTANLGVSARGFGVAENKLVLRMERRSGNIWLLPDVGSPPVP